MAISSLCKTKTFIDNKLHNFLLFISIFQDSEAGIINEENKEGTEKVNKKIVDQIELSTTKTKTKPTKAKTMLDLQIQYVKKYFLDKIMKENKGESLDKKAELIDEVLSIS